jgi:Leucine-rich repeat (LRR) protein
MMQFAGMLITMALAVAFLPVCVAVSLAGPCYRTNCTSPSADIDNLKKFWESTNGPDWTVSAFTRAWNFTRNSTGHYLNQPCHADIESNQYTNTWVGVDCICTTKTICQISQLVLTSLNGTIPSELTQLTTLQEISLSNGGLTGSIPWEILAMPKLTQLYLARNTLRGSIPNTTSVSNSFQVLILDWNLLTGTIPESLSTFTRMNELSMQHNSLTGMHRCDSRMSLHVIYEYLTNLKPKKGTVPEALSRLNNLITLSLNDNSLAGQIPSSLCSGFENPQVTLSLQNNELTGSIPWTCGLTDKIKSLDVSGNLLYGSIPSNLGSAITLQSVHLENNRLTGGLPRALLSVQELYLSSNLLSGDLPTPPCSSTTTTILLDGNRFTGIFLVGNDFLA